MMYRMFRLTGSKALIMAAVAAALLLAHGAIAAWLNYDEPVLFLAAALVVPMWAISAAVYTFDTVMIPRGRGWRHPV